MVKVIGSIKYACKGFEPQCLQPFPTPLPASSDEVAALEGRQPVIDCSIAEFLGAKRALGSVRVVSFGQEW